MCCLRLPQFVETRKIYQEWFICDIGLLWVSNHLWNYSQQVANGLALIASKSRTTNLRCSNLYVPLSETACCSHLFTYWCILSQYTYFLYWPHSCPKVVYNRSRSIDTVNNVLRCLGLAFTFPLFSWMLLEFELDSSLSWSVFLLFWIYLQLLPEEQQRNNHHKWLVRGKSLWILFDKDQGIWKCRLPSQPVLFWGLIGCKRRWPVVMSLADFFPNKKQWETTQHPFPKGGDPVMITFCHLLVTIVDVPSCGGSIWSTCML